MNEETKSVVTCRRCGCTVWNLHETYTTVIETETTARTASPIKAWEYRCASCGVKATIQETEAVNRLTGQPEGEAIAPIESESEEPVATEALAVA